MLTACQIGLCCHSQLFYFRRSQSLDPGFHPPRHRKEDKGKSGEIVDFSILKNGNESTWLKGMS